MNLIKEKNNMLKKLRMYFEKQPELAAICFGILIFIGLNVYGLMTLVAPGSDSVLKTIYSIVLFPVSIFAFGLLMPGLWIAYLLKVPEAAMLVSSIFWAGFVYLFVGWPIRVQKGLTKKEK